MITYKDIREFINNKIEEKLQEDGNSLKEIQSNVLYIKNDLKDSLEISKDTILEHKDENLSVNRIEEEGFYRGIQHALSLFKSYDL